MSTSAVKEENNFLMGSGPRGVSDRSYFKNEIGGSILVSKLGTDGAIGEEKLPDLIRRVYGLDVLNERYDDFLNSWQVKQKSGSLFGVATDYLSVLKEDPQLPFPLLPRDFLGEKAYLLYQSLVNKKS